MKRLAWIPLACTTLLFAGTGVLWALAYNAGIKQSERDSLVLLVEIAVAMIVFAAMGGLIASNRPQNPIGWIFGGTAVVVGVRAITDSWTKYGHVTPRDVFAWELSGWISNWVWIPAIGTIGVFLFLLFPTGRAPSRRWRIVGWFGVIAMASTIGSAMFARRLDQYPYLPNPFAGPPWLETVLGLGYPMLVASIAGAIASLVVRGRRAGSIEREQIKWFAFAGALFVIGFAMSVFVPFDDTISLSFVFLPLMGMSVASAVAIQRYRLLEIERIISRTFSYAIITAIGAAVFVLVAIVPTAILGTGRRPDWLIAVATLVLFAIFRPVRRRVQNRVDRRFNRARYDAEHTIDSFASRLREQVDIDALGAELQGVVTQTMQPTHVSLWLR